MTPKIPSCFADRKIIPPGIYIGLSDEKYHADAALGSSNLRRVAISPPDYWFDSFMNPAREDDKDTPATKRGTAVHVLVLYGEEAFSQRYMRIPHTSDMSSGEKAALTKKYNEKAAATGKIALGSKVYDNVAISSAMISRNKELSYALIGGLNEVSIFWIDEETGLPLKARIDCLKPRGVGDLKSITNRMDKSFPQACRDSIATYRYDGQAAHYMNARARIFRFWASEQVFAINNAPYDVDLLKQVAHEKEYAWQWVWWQAEGAPITYSRVLSPKNPMLENGRILINRGKDQFLKFSEMFGSDVWVLEEPATELYQEEMPGWYARD